MCRQLPDIPRSFAFLKKKRDPNSVSPPSPADVIPLALEVRVVCSMNVAIATWTMLILFSYTFPRKSAEASQLLHVRFPCDGGASNAVCAAPLRACLRVLMCAFRLLRRYSTCWTEVPSAKILVLQEQNSSCKYCWRAL